MSDLVSAAFDYQGRLLVAAPELLSASDEAPNPPAYDTEEDCFRRQIVEAGLSTAQYDEDMQKAAVRVCALAKSTNQLSTNGRHFSRAVLFRGGALSQADVDDHQVDPETMTPAMTMTIEAAKAEKDLVEDEDRSAVTEANPGTLAVAPLQA